MIEGDFDENFKFIIDEIVKLCEKVVKIIVVVIMDEFDEDKLKVIVLGDNFVVLLQFGEDREEVKKVLFIVV